MQPFKTMKISIALATVGGLLAATGCAANAPSGGGGANNLEITSWWTSGSEADALQVTRW